MCGCIVAWVSVMQGITLAVSGMEPHICSARPDYGGAIAARQCATRVCVMGRDERRQSCPWPSVELDVTPDA